MDEHEEAWHEAFAYADARTSTADAVTYAAHYAGMSRDEVYLPSHACAYLDWRTLRGLDAARALSAGRLAPDAPAAVLVDWCIDNDRPDLEAPVRLAGDVVAATGDVVGYVQQPDGPIVLMDWHGRHVLHTGADVVETYHTYPHGDKALALLWHVGPGRYVVGYALDDAGTLFRGELMDGATRDDAEERARDLAAYWIERDADDAEAQLVALDDEEGDR